MSSRTLSALAVSSRFSQSDDFSSCTKSECSVKVFKLLESFITGNELSICSHWPYSFLKPLRPSAIAAVSSSLPTAKPTEKASKNLPNLLCRWSARAIKSFAMAELEARKLKYPKTGTESLLMGILVEGTSIAAKFLRKNGITLFKVREEAVKLLGKSDMYFFSPEHPPLTEPAQRVLDWALEEKLKSGESGEVTSTHLLLGIWKEKEAAGHKIMAALGFDDEKANELAKSKDTDIILSFK